MTTDKKAKYLDKLNFPNKCTNLRQLLKPPVACISFIGRNSRVQSFFSGEVERGHINNNNNNLHHIFRK